MTRAKTAVDHVQSRIELPDTYTSRYTARDKMAVQRIVAWINEGQSHVPGLENKRSVRGLARVANVSQTTARQILQGVYPSPPGRHLKAMLGYIDREEDRRRSTVRVPIVETSITRLVTFVCQQAHRNRDFGIISGYVGIGKTEALKRYAAENDDAVLLHGSADMNPPVMLRHLVELTGAVVHKSNRYARGTKAEMMDAVTVALAGTDRLIILDEADKCMESCLEYFRRISDLAEVGAVISGTEKLHYLVRDPSGRHGQISSRVGFWPPVVKSITREDSDRIAAAIFKENEIDAPHEEALDAFWQVCEGHARVLAKLCQKTIEFGIQRGHELTAQLVYQTGQQLMGLKRAREVK